MTGSWNDGLLVIAGAGALGAECRVEGERGELRTATARNALTRCIERWRPVLRLFADDLMLNPFSVSKVLTKSWRYLPRLKGTLAHELIRSFSDEEVRAAAAAVTLYTGIPVEKTPAAQIIGLVAMLDEGFYLPVGGMGAIAHILRDAYLNLGGELRLNTRVERIQVKSGSTTGVLVRDGEPIESAIVVATPGAMQTFRHLIAPDEVPPSIMKRVGSASISHSALGVQLGLANRLTRDAFAVNHIPLMPRQHEMLVPQPGAIRWFMYTVPTTVLPELAPENGSVLEMFVSVDPARPVNAWDDRAANDLAERAISAVRQHCELDIQVKRILSPRTFAEQKHLYNGALYGLSPATTFEHFRYRSGIEGLFLAGQTTWPGYGVGPALASGLLSAESVLRSLADQQDLNAS